MVLPANGWWWTSRGPDRSDMFPSRVALMAGVRCGAAEAAARSRSERVLHRPSGHAEDCPCVRCVGFGPKTAAAPGMAATSPRCVCRMAPSRSQASISLTPHLPVAGAAFEATLAGYAIALRVSSAPRLRSISPRRRLRPGGSEVGEKVSRLRQDLRGWLSTCLRYADALGLTPSAQARILRDAGVGDAASAQAALREHLQAEYGEEADDGVG